MKTILEGDRIVIRHKKTDGRFSYTNLNKIRYLSDHKVITTMMIAYCEGKSYKSIISWINRVNSTLNALIEKTDINRLPETSNEWRIFIKNWYGITLTTSKLKAKIETRVSVWNKNIRPFLIFLQFRELIPIDVLVPPMGKVGEKIKSTSFKVSLIGETPPKRVEKNKDINNLIIPITLSRNDADYLDEIQFELERRRDKLYACLKNYWQAIKLHYEFGQKIFKSIDKEKLLSRINRKDVFDYNMRPGRVPPLRYHIAASNYKEGFNNCLFLLQEFGIGYSVAAYRHPAFPSKAISSYLLEGYDPFPECKIENVSEIPICNRINWCFGILCHRDISYITALLIMLNPKFTFESLLQSNISDKNGKTLLEITESGKTFSIEKMRAKSIKTEVLNDTSLEIISTITEMNVKNRKYADASIKDRLFLVLDRFGKKLVSPSHTRVSNWITGYDSSNSNAPYSGKCLMHFYPSLKEYGLIENTITHSKIRATEGVLEWFRTGSVRSASRRLGNSNRVALEHYIPKELIAAYNTRQIRRFQNLLITTATINENYLLEAVDFTTLNEGNCSYSIGKNRFLIA
ncbi:hypothetical protein NX722_18275 [Endozoicomonas gorgoniicola]|uniref:Uncharacterized protein n=1 Tax=Endozoicomonas gorgoniicola TaxID=1234144 RepID=A0ABT3MZU9_9GAMM|nr:hypothetical protein [Endozoicomonas gorgoniicola]MCW7554534.1 hypothetical protein [Endozoicomonas gorgoniicola]